MLRFRWPSFRNERTWIASFGILLFFFSVLLAFVIPPAQVIDEPGHFVRSYALTQGTWRCTTHEGKSGMWVPETIGKMHYAYQTTHLPGRAENIYTGPSAPVHISPELFFLRQPYCEAPPTPYIPQAIGIGIGRVLQLDVQGLLIAGRISNSFVCIFLLCLGALLIPFGKRLVLFLGCVPMMLYQMSSTSPDGMLFAGALFFICYTLYLGRKEQLSLKQVLLYGLLSVLLIEIKVGYQLLLFLALVLQPKQFKKSSHYIWFLLLLVLSHLAVFVLIRTVFHLQPGDIPPHTDRGASFWFILQQPLEFFFIIIRTVQQEGIIWLLEMMGSIGWQDRLLSVLHYGLLGCGLGILLLPRSSEESGMEPRERIVAMGVALSVFVSVCAALYVLMNHPGTSPIIGIQGKYFLPVGFLVLFSLFGLRLRAWFPPLLLVSICIISSSALLSAVSSRYSTPTLDHEQTLLSYPVTFSDPLRYELTHIPEDYTLRLVVDTTYPYPLVPFAITLRDEGCNSTIARNVPYPDVYVTDPTLRLELPQDTPLGACVEIRPIRKLGNSLPLFLKGYWKAEGFHPLEQ